MSRSVSSREVRLQEKDDLDWTVSREMSRGDGEKAARRNINFRNIRYLVHVSYVTHGHAP